MVKKVNTQNNMAIVVTLASIKMEDQFYSIAVYGSTVMYCLSIYEFMSLNSSSD